MKFNYGVIQLGIRIFRYLDYKTIFPKTKLYNNRLIIN